MWKPPACPRELAKTLLRLHEYEHHIASLTQAPRWRDEISKELARRLKRKREILKLSPTTRSLL
jgi:hypothetical protein